MANGWNLWVWLVSVVVGRYIYYRYPHNNNNYYYIDAHTNNTGAKNNIIIHI